jgi:hypothetical protein
LDWDPLEEGHADGRTLEENDYKSTKDLGHDIQ